MRKIVVNDCFGGFGLSTEGLQEYAKLAGMEVYYGPHGFKILLKVPQNVYEAQKLLDEESGDWSKSNEMVISDPDIPRDDPNLIKVVQELGEKVDAPYASLEIVEIPEDVKWHIVEEFDGTEHVDEDHRTWYP